MLLLVHEYELSSESASQSCGDSGGRLLIVFSYLVYRVIFIKLGEEIEIKAI